MKLSEHKAGAGKSLNIATEAAADDGRRHIQIPKWLLRPSCFLALGITAASIAGVWYSYSNHSEFSLTIPVPADLERLDPQLRAYLVEKLNWVREKPRDANRQSTLGMVYASNGLWEQAREAFRNAGRLARRQPLPAMYAAVATQELGDVKEALRLFHELTVRFPDFAQAYARLGDASLRAGEVAAAEAAFRRLVASAPGERRGYSGMGDVKLRYGEYAEAAKELEKAIQLAPSEKIAHHLLGLAYRGLGRAEDAEIELRRGLNAQYYPMPDPWEATASQHMKLLPDLFEMAKQYSAAGKPDKAVAILEEALKFHPGNIGVMNHLAVAYNGSGLPQKGRDLLLQVIGEDNRNVSAYVGLSYSCTALGAYDGAISYACRAIELATNNAQGYVAKANALLASEQDNDALAALESAFRCDPKNADIQMMMGDVCLKNLNLTKEAIDHYESAAKLEPVLVSAYVRIAQLHIERSEPGQSREAIRMIRKLAPTSPALKLLEERLRILEQQKSGRD